MGVKWRNEGIKSRRTRADRGVERVPLRGFPSVPDGQFVYAESIECKKIKRC
jgi:hypothetical protein